MTCEVCGGDCGPLLEHVFFTGDTPATCARRGRPFRPAGWLAYDAPLYHLHEAGDVVCLCSAACATGYRAQKVVAKFDKVDIVSLQSKQRKR
jgi:hypothetical protein